MSCKVYNGLCEQQGACGAIGKLGQDISNNQNLISNDETPMTFVDADRFIKSCKKKGCFGDIRELEVLAARFPK